VTTGTPLTPGTGEAPDHLGGHPRAPGADARAVGAAEEALAVRLEMSRRAVEQLEGERERLERLLLRLPSLTAELDPERLTTGVAEAARELTAARFGLYLAPGQEAKAGTLVGLEPSDFAEPPTVARAPMLAGVAWQAGTRRVDDVSQWAPGEEAARAYGVFADGRLVRSWLAAPVQGRDGRSLGALYLGHHRAHAFTGRHEELIGGLCVQLGVALENAALFAERSRVATALQETLLPPLLPDIPGVDLAARYHTRAGNVVGGDFYDLFELGAGAWGLVLGDVSGFGSEAAALTGLARYSIRALAPGAERPGAVLEQLNETMLRQGTSERFLTAVFARIQPSRRRVEVTLASGGHPPAVVLRDDESVEVLDRATGTLLGAFEGISLPDEHLTLRAGDALVLVTDGVIEARDEAGSEFGLGRLEQLVGTCAGRSAEGIARRIERYVLDHRGERSERPQDDVAILVVRAEPS
jgi:hypothetical protein